jgi:hypothetical protein
MNHMICIRSFRKAGFWQSGKQKDPYYYDDSLPYTFLTCCLF